jgi:glycolate oxidase
MTLMVEFARLEDAARAVAETIAGGLMPRCAELLDRRTLDVMRSAGHPFSGEASALLILETDGDETSTEREASRIAEHCERANALNVLVAQSNSQRDRIWETRSEMSRAVRAFAKHKLSEDVVVPRQNLVALLDTVDELGDRERVRTLTYGHAGDGNMHVNFLWDDEEEKLRVDRAVLGLFEKTIDLGGTLSGEHGIGATKAAYLGLEQSPQLIALQKRLKDSFDPNGLLNPGKIFPKVGHGSC